MSFIILTPALGCPSLVAKGDPLEVLLLAEKKDIKKDISCITYSQWTTKKEKTLDLSDIELVGLEPKVHVSPLVAAAYKKEGFSRLVKARIKISPEKGLYQLFNPFSRGITRIAFTSEPCAYPGMESVEVHHPFYVEKKDYLNIAHISDSHLASRINLLEERWDSNYDQVWSASSLSGEKPGKFSNYNTQFEYILRRINRDPSIDIIIHTGDIVDYNRGHYNLEKRNDLSKDYYMNKNWLLFYEVLYRNYEKPFFSVLGNHDYRLHPYPPNPVFIARRIREFFNLAPTVNLTRKEMNTIHEDPHSLSIGPKNHLLTSFHAPRWYSLVINPLLDHQVFYKKMAFLMLDWNRGEDHERGSPWASKVLSDNQWNLLMRWYQHVADLRTKGNLVAVVVMHSSVFNPFPEMGDSRLKDNPHTQIFYESGLTDGYSDTDLVDGTFRLKRDDFIRLCVGNDNYGIDGDFHIFPEKGIDLILNGHAHRSGIFQIEGPHVWLRTPDKTGEGPLFCNAVSCGPIGIKNQKGGSRRVQPAPPGYHTVSFDEKGSAGIAIIPSMLVSVREETRRDYGEIAAGDYFEVADEVKNKGVGATYEWGITNLRKKSSITRIKIATGILSDSESEFRSRYSLHISSHPLGWRHTIENHKYVTIVCEAHERGQGILYSDQGTIKVKVEPLPLEKMGTLTVYWDRKGESHPVVVRVPAG